MQDANEISLIVVVCHIGYLRFEYSDEKICFKKAGCQGDNPSRKQYHHIGNIAYLTKFDNFCQRYVAMTLNRKSSGFITDIRIT